jgi:hypothetical protein
MVAPDMCNDDAHVDTSSRASATRTRGNGRLAIVSDRFLTRKG